MVVGAGWSDKTKVILKSTQFKFKLSLKLELNLAIIWAVATYFIMKEIYFLLGWCIKVGFGPLGAVLSGEVKG